MIILVLLVNDDEKNVDDNYYVDVEGDNDDWSRYQLHNAFHLCQ